MQTKRFCRNSRAKLRRELEWLASKGQRVELVSSGRCSVFEQIELALLEHVHGLDACNEGASAAKRLESEHGSHDAFDRPMVLLDEVVEVFRLTHLDVYAAVSTHVEDRRRVGATLVDRDLLGHAVQADGTLEEASRR